MTSVVSVSIVFITLFSVTLSATGKPPYLCMEGGRLIHLTNGEADEVETNQDRSYALISSYQSESFKVLDLKTGKISEYQKPINSSVGFINTGEIAYTPFDGVDISSAKTTYLAMKKAKTVLIDPKTRKTREVHGKFLYGKQLYSAVSHEGQRTLIVRNEAGKEKRVELFDQNSNTISQYSDNPSDPDVTYKKQEKVIQLKDGNKVLYSGPLDIGDSAWLPGGFSQNKKLFVTSIAKESEGSATKYELAVIDLEKKSQKILSLPDSYMGGNFDPDDANKKISKDSRHLLLDNNGSSDEIKSIDLATGKITTHAKFGARDPYFDDSGNICGESSNTSKNKSVRKCFDFKTGNLVSQIEIPVDVGNMSGITANDFVVNIWGWGNGQQGQSYYFSHRKICPQFVVPVDCDCQPKRVSNLTPIVESAKDIAVATACSKEFAPADWKNLPASDVKLLDEKSSLILLKRFSKPGGFEAADHTGLVLGMLQSGLHKKYPAEFRAAVGGIIYNSDRLYESLLEKYPEIASLPAKPDQSCQTTKERDVISAAIADYAKARILSARHLKFSELSSILSLTKDSLPDARKEAIAELAADQLVFSAGDSAELNQVFPSKVYKFAENKLKAALGLKSKNLTDLTVVRDGANLVFYQLGVQPFSESKETVAGFHIKSAKSVPVSSLPDNKSVENLKWLYDGNEYSAQVEINKHKLEREIVSKAKAPNYAEMWKGKEFRGVVVAGTNLGTGLTDAVIKEYIAYYAQQGFKFDEPKVSDDLPKFLQESTSGSSPMHYFVKEAHSDGDEKNLFRISTQGKILRGTRVVGDKKEIVDLVYPTANTKSTLISNQDFGKWVQSREKAGGPELIYFNSSCWSKSKAVYEISAAATPKLINIPTTTAMYTFTNSEKSVMRAVIDGVRNRKSYEEIREMMKSNPRYAAKSGDVFVFPDEDEYQRQVTDVIKTPVDVNPRLFVKKPGGTQVPYSIEENN